MRLVNITIQRIALALFTVGPVGCDSWNVQPPYARRKAEPPPHRSYDPDRVNSHPIHYSQGKVLLGSPGLTAGIPGDGPLTLPEIENWLADPAVHEPLDFILPLGLREAQEQVHVPEDNPLTRAKIELGRQLFFDRRLSHESLAISCADCHHPTMRYADPTLGPGDAHPGEVDRAAPVVFNRILSTAQFWDGRAASLEDQVLGPLTAIHEMATTLEDCVQAVSAVPGYHRQFEVIFGGVTMTAIAQAIATFERALVTGPTAVDAWRVRQRYETAGTEGLSAAEREEYVEAVRLTEAHPLPETALRGMELFHGDKARCSACHTGPNLTDEKFHNLGVSWDDPVEPDLGRYLATGREEDQGAFKTPTLVNIHLTGPYMHAGQIRTLGGVLDWHTRGGQANPWLSPEIRPFELSESEREDLLAFLVACEGELPYVGIGRLPE